MHGDSHGVMKFPQSFWLKTPIWTLASRKVLVMFASMRVVEQEYSLHSREAVADPPTIRIGGPNVRGPAGEATLTQQGHPENPVRQEGDNIKKL